MPRGSKLKGTKARMPRKMPAAAMARMPQGVLGFATFAAHLDMIRQRIPIRWPPAIFLAYQRKSQAALTTNEKDRFLCAYSILIASPAPYGWLGPFVDIHDMLLATGAHFQHGTQRFLPWHRIYLLLLEQQLRSIHPDVAIPYWDWTVDRSFPSWLAGFTPTVTTPAQGAITVTRAPGLPDNLPTAAEINAVMGITSFPTFTGNLEGYHNSVHVWVGGTMGSIPTAPCDPVFFMHHANIDRLWSQWQAANPGQNPNLPGPTPGPSSPVMDPWAYTETDTRSIAALGYKYA